MIQTICLHESKVLLCTGPALHVSSRVYYPGRMPKYADGGGTYKAGTIISFIWLDSGRVAHALIAWHIFHVM